MQVSWIEPDDVRDLVAMLAEPAARGSSAAPDLDTLPEEDDRSPFEFLSEKPSAPSGWQSVGAPPAHSVHRPAPEPLAMPSPTPVPAPLSATPPVPWSPSPPPTAHRFAPAIASETPNTPSAVDVALQPDVSRIRAKLRVIRDRAEEAGLLNKETPVPAPPSAPAPGPVPPPTAPSSYHAPVPPAPMVPAMPLFASKFQLATESETADEGVPSGFTAPTTPLFAASGQLAVDPALPSQAAAPALEPAPVAAALWTAQEHSTIVERLDEFARWSMRLTTSEELFMLDDHGDLIWGSPTSDGLLVCAKLAMNASMRSQSPTLSKPAPTMTVQVSPGKELQLISCATRHGNVTLALVNPREVPAVDLREALITAVNA